MYNFCNGDVRLVGGNSVNEGRVEICYNGVWGSVCNDGWDNSEAAIVCRQLGFPGDCKQTMICCNYILLIIMQPTRYNPDMLYIDLL